VAPNTANLLAKVRTVSVRVHLTSTRKSHPAQLGAVTERNLNGGAGKSGAALFLGFYTRIGISTYSASGLALSVTMVGAEPSEKRNSTVSAI